VVYPEQDMAYAVKTFALFNTRNSHWNVFGAFIAVGKLFEAMGLPPLEIADIPLDIVSKVDDLSMKWTQGFTTRRRVLQRPYHEDILVDVPNHVGKHIRLTHVNARSDQTVMIFGDSFAWNYANGVSRFLSLHYREVHFIWKKVIDWGLVDSVKPNVLLLESAERFLLKGLQ
jgi:hypothetical protein